MRWLMMVIALVALSGCAGAIRSLRASRAPGTGRIKQNTNQIADGKWLINVSSNGAGQQNAVLRRWHRLAKEKCQGDYDPDMSPNADSRFVSNGRGGGYSITTWAASGTATCKMTEVVASGPAVEAVELVTVSETADPLNDTQWAITVEGADGSVMGMVVRRWHELAQEKCGGEFKPDAKPTERETQWVVSGIATCGEQELVTVEASEAD